MTHHSTLTFGLSFSRLVTSHTHTHTHTPYAILLGSFADSFHTFHTHPHIKHTASAQPLNTCWLCQNLWSTSVTLTRPGHKTHKYLLWYSPSLKLSQYCFLSFSVFVTYFFHSVLPHPLFFPPYVFIPHSDWELSQALLHSLILLINNHHSALLPLGLWPNGCLADDADIVLTKTFTLDKQLLGGLAIITITVIFKKIQYWHDDTIWIIWQCPAQCIVVYQFSWFSFDW